ncbi:hypothetical protein QJS04_geneDACA024543 [Acorus gramineus]|uniref:Protein MIZU-KUSSEI 1 n=1 Tax=Acorus gramineus TaxID=55184 RepID=A0AAV8ZYU7_ACOGR|nr:hypothetical protein QJS04_geneDACA024543 [Acorus gramineus]
MVDPSQDPPSPPPQHKPPPPPQPSGLPPRLSLVQPPSSHHHHHRRSVRVFRVIRHAFRSFPIFTPSCKIPHPSINSSSSSSTNPTSGGHLLPESRRSLSGTRITGTLFGYRKGRVSLAMQENPRCLPTMVVELAMHTHVLLKELGSGMVRIALECEKRHEKDRTRLVDEPLWTMYCNGKKSGYGVRRDASEEDLVVMELLRPMSMGAGVLPSATDATLAAEDGEMAYMRAHFERVVGSRDSETLYMLSPDGNNGPDLTIFLVRI